MLKIFFLLFLACLSLVSPAQSSPASTEQDMYLKRSKKQKTFAKIFMWTGITITSAALFAYAGDSGGTDDPRPGALAAGVGIGAISIPLFIASSKNRKKAEGVTASLQIMEVPGFVNSSLKYYPRFGFKLQLP